MFYCLPLIVYFGQTGTKMGRANQMAVMVLIKLRLRPALKNFKRIMDAQIKGELGSMQLNWMPIKGPYSISI